MEFDLHLLIGSTDVWHAANLVVFLLVLGLLFRSRKLLWRWWAKLYPIVRHAKETHINPDTRPDPKPFRATEVYREWHKHKEWLISGWSLEMRFPELNSDQPELQWRFLQASEKEVDYLRNNGLPPDVEISRQGQTSDIMGLTMPINLEQTAILNYFNVPCSRFSKTFAEREIRWLFESPENRAEWHSRQLDPMQVAFFVFMGIPVPPAMKAEEAQVFINNCMMYGGEVRDQKLAAWHSLEGICQELTCDTVAKTFGILKPEPVDIGRAFSQLIAQGRSPSELYIQTVLVVRQLLKLKPELAINKSNLTHAESRI